jgi:hypothetical protein
VDSREQDFKFFVCDDVQKVVTEEEGATILQMEENGDW